MEKMLKLNQFEELTETEMQMVEGGDWQSDVNALCGAFLTAGDVMGALMCYGPIVAVAGGFFAGLVSLF